MSPLFSQPQARVFIPDGQDPRAALARATHLCVAAHPDDAEFMALAGILEARASRGFACVVLADGASGPDARPGLAAERAEEACCAAGVGGYAALILLGHASAQVKDPAQAAPDQDLDLMLRLCRPRRVFLHQPFDRHPTHRAACLRALGALRRLEKSARPEQVVGCEVWGSLDWLPAPWRLAQPLQNHVDLAKALAACFSSQLKVKAYGAALLGRLRANATFEQSHLPDSCTGLALGMDMRSFLDGPDIQQGLAGVIKTFAGEATDLVRGSAGFRS